MKISCGFINLQLTLVSIFFGNIEEFANSAAIKEANLPSGVYNIELPGYTTYPLYVDNHHAVWYQLLCFSSHVCSSHRVSEY